MLTGDRPSLPRYLDLGRVTTYAILPGRRRRRPAPPGIELGRGEEGCLPEILGFLTACGRRRQFGAAFGTSLDPASHFRDFQAGDFYLARKDGRLVGAVGVWDQRAFRRTRVTGYAPWLAPLRPLLDFLLRASGHAGLPPPGAHLDEAYLAFRGVEGDDPAILAALLESIVQDRAGGSCHALLTTFHERDPLAAALGPFRTIPCRARLFWVCWDEGMPFFQALDPALVPALEAARL
jgi:hypothetical protein